MQEEGNNFKTSRIFGYFSRYETVLKVGIDVETYNWKPKVSKSIKPPEQWHFDFIKRMIITKNLKDVILVCGESVYNRILE